MGYLLDQMEKVASFAEDAMMEKLALNRAEREAKRKAAKAANDAGRKANKAVKAAVTGGDTVADVIPQASDAALDKVKQVRAHGANRARNLIGELRIQKRLKDKYFDDLWKAKGEIRGWTQESKLLNNALARARESNDALRADKLKLSQQAAQLTDDLDNFKNLGRFAGAAKWIKGNPKKALGAAILGGGGILGGAGTAGYALNDGE